MRKQRFFATAGEKRKFYNNMRHFGHTRDIGLAGFAMLPALLPITLIAMILFAVAVFLIGPTETNAASTGFNAKHQMYTVLGMAAVTRRSIELKDEKLKLTNDYRLILDKAKDEKRAYTTTEEETLAKMDADFDKLDKQIKLHEKQEAREADAATRDPRLAATQPGADAQGNFKATGIRGTKEYKEAFAKYLKSGDAAFASASPEIRAALQVDSDTAGGYTVASEQFSTQFIQAVNDQVFIRDLATKETVATAVSLGIPTLAADPNDADWTAEILTGAEDSNMSFGKRELFPHPLAKLIKISNKLLRMSPNVEAKVLERLAYKFAIPQEKAFLLGTGAQQPLGVFTPTADGISVNRDVVTGSVNQILADSLFDAMYTLKAQYQAKAVWIFHRDGIRQIRKLKDLQNRYLWEPAITAGQPDLILGRPFYMSEYCPNTFTTGLYVGIVGDFSKYVIADALSFSVQRAVELFAATNQTGFFGRAETDGMPVLEEAFVRLKTS
ncbi:MAG TPA: phage major capsid protein [Candidatus Angelobacter sp.]|jgi:HK97 family phage major capsid protein|nr:phage major capsid protein [Candidatus Angelobacter sp.]